MIKRALAFLTSFLLALGLTNGIANAQDQSDLNTINRAAASVGAQITDANAASTVTMSENITINYLDSKWKISSQNSINSKTIAEDGKSLAIDRQDGLQIATIYERPGKKVQSFNFSNSYLDETENGYVIVRSELFGEPIAIIDPAWAVDASGKEIETSFKIEGNQLIQETTIPDDSQFPVVADPYIRDVNGPWGKVGQDLVFTPADLALIAGGLLTCEKLLEKASNVPARLIGITCGGLASFLTISGVAAIPGGKCLAIRAVGFTYDTPNAVFPVFVEC